MRWRYHTCQLLPGLAGHILASKSKSRNGPEEVKPGPTPRSCLGCKTTNNDRAAERAMIVLLGGRRVFSNRYFWRADIINITPAGSLGAGQRDLCLKVGETERVQ